MRKAVESVESTTNPNHQICNDQQTPNMSVYEKTRQERIKENHERMKKMGLVDLSLKLKSVTAPKRTPRNHPSTPKHPSPLHPPGPLRRSSRLHNATPVSYSEAVLAKKNMLLEDEDVILEAGTKPEIYTEEHMKLLGNTERSWTFFVDGYGKDGRRIYDQVDGKTCHQCRQKTLGYRTHCSKCQIVQGQFCGDCLYMRYGEHVLEAIENPNWICPVCRGICNCSLCRHAKGWAPTGPLYKKVSHLGYKSVAHYLIQTRRSQDTVGKEMVTVNQVSAKRLLPFSDMETISKGSLQIIPKTKKEKQLPNGRNMATDGQTKRSLPFSGGEAQSGNMEFVEDQHQVHDHLGLLEPMFEGKRESELKKEEEEEEEEEKQLSGSGNLSTGSHTKRPLPFPGRGALSDNMESVEINLEVCGQVGFSMPIQSEIKRNEEKQLQPTDKVHDKCSIVLESLLELERVCALSFEPSPDSIAARLRSRDPKTDAYGSGESSGINEKNSDVKQSVSDMFSNQEVKKAKEMHIHVEDDKHLDEVNVFVSCPKLKKKTARANEPNPDSIGGRLRWRRRMSRGAE